MSREGRNDSRNRKRNVQDAARNLERAVEELASAATEEVSGRAASLLDEAAARVRGQSGAGDSSRRHDEDETGREEHRSRRVHYRDYEDLSRRSRGLYLDRENRKIVGVCAGLARYLGMEAWMVRCVALTGLLFVPSVVFPAYWIVFIVMGHRPSGRAGSRRAGTERHGRRRARVRGRSSRHRHRDHRSSAPASRARYSPRESLRAAQADFAEVELRLRRMEAFVTSDRYALERGFAEIGANTAAGSPPDTESRQHETDRKKER